MRSKSSTQSIFLNNTGPRSSATAPSSLAVLAIAALIYVYRGHQQTARQDALSKALAVAERSRRRRPPSPARTLSFPTEDAKDKEAIKAFSELAAKYSGTDEGYIAEYFLGSIAVEQGNLGEADKRFTSVADGAGKKYASLAKLSLGQLYFSEGKPADGEKLLRSLMDNPTVLSPKIRPLSCWRKMLAPTNPAEARKLLDPLRGKTGAVSQAAIQAYGELRPQ